MKITATSVLLCTILLAIWCGRLSADDSAVKADPRYPYRTNFGNAHLPWYQYQPGVFPPPHSSDRQWGEVVEIDGIRRTGVFRHAKSGELVNFALLPFAIAACHGYDTELRDVPPSAAMLFFLLPDEKGSLTQVVNLYDQFTMDVRHERRFRVKHVNSKAGTIAGAYFTFPDGTESPTQIELTTSSETHFRKAKAQSATIDDVAPGQAILFNASMTPQGRGSCTDIWIDAESQAFQVAAQKAKRVAFLKERGLPGWVDEVTGDQMVVTMFNRDSEELIDKSFEPSREATGKVRVAVAEKTLQTYDPGSDSQIATLLEVGSTSKKGNGSSGRQLVLKPQTLLEGFRKNRVVRVFAPGWPVKSPPKDERLRP